MPKKKKLIDEVGAWTDVKHDVLRRYCERYALIMKHAEHLTGEYVEGFAGSGLVLRKSTGELNAGSALIALGLDPPFTRYHFVEMDAPKAEHLRNAVSSSDRADLVTVYGGDCNEILPQQVFPRFARQHKRRGFCLLDPYGLHLNWSVIAAAGSYGTLELMINFPAMDIEMNAFKRDPKRVSQIQADRFTAFWGDESWMQAGYDPSLNLFGEPEKTHMSALVTAFCKRLQDVAGFKFVAKPGRFRNCRESILYYMVFATNNEAGHRIGEYVLTKFT